MPEPHSHLHLRWTRAVADPENNESLGNAKQGFRTGRVDWTTSERCAGRARGGMAWGGSVHVLDSLNLVRL